MTGSCPALAVVLPCYNEASIVGDSIARLREWFPSAVVVVVDDGSVDGTAERAEEAAATDTGVRVLRLAANGGKGGAVAAAVPLASDCASVLVVDADLAFTRATLDRVVAALDGVDVAIGNRRHADSTYTVPVRQFGFLYHRHVVGQLFNVIVRTCLGLQYRDTQCGIKAFRAAAFGEIMRRLTTTGFAFDLEVLLLARGLGLTVGEVAVALRIETGRSSVRLLRDGLTALKEVGKLAARRATGRYTRARRGEREHR
jgi:glycosyltransferase involved in cell wall biosynthesis